MGDSCAHGGDVLVALTGCWVPQRVIAQAQARAVSARALSTASRSYVARVGGQRPVSCTLPNATCPSACILLRPSKLKHVPLSTAAIPGAGAGALRSLVRQTPAVLASSGARFASSFKTAYDAKVPPPCKPG